MKLRLIAVLSCACFLFAQSPNLTGVWKANLEKSKVNGPAPSSYLEIIEQQGSKLTETIGITSPRGEQRSSYTADTSGKPTMNSYRGLPMRTVASSEGGALTLTSKVAGPRPATVTEKYTLSPDGNTLTVETVTSSNGKDTQQTMVLEKQPDSAGEALRKPEQTAGVRFKNVQLLKDLPASHFLDSMGSFSMSLGTNCEHCHVRNDFASDDKPAKLMARKMITMTRNINEQTFAGKMEVRCYTCHKGQIDPQSRPAFQ
ncbi:MAG: c-type cytochrome [Acidobacteriota bacterium]|nr:c-type cytochrome [Acidobacteriota bacterium]